MKIDLRERLILQRDLNKSKFKEMQFFDVNVLFKIVLLLGMEIWNDQKTILEKYSYGI